VADHSSSALAIRNIAIATDFSPWSYRATQHALVMARQFGAALHFLHTVRRSEFSFVPELQVAVSLDQLAQRDYQDLICRLRAIHSLDDIENHYWNMDGEVSEVFEDFVRDRKIDLLVLGTRDRSVILKLLLGSTAKQIFDCVGCPVVTLGPRSPGAGRYIELKKILLATDLSRESRAAIPYVLTAAWTWGAEVDILHVCSSVKPHCLALMEEFGQRMNILAGDERRVTIRTHVLSGEPSEVVLDFARRESEGLIVLGLDRHRSLYNGPSLSHANEIVHQARCPVLSVRSI
jgi:nucleotide-binding universal stress UspA family protein